MSAAVRRRIQTPWGPWEPYEISQMAAALRAAPTPWWVGGGHALEAFVGRRWREHDDVDAGLFREDAPALRRNLARWDVHKADPPGTLTPWSLESSLPPHVHDVWVRESPDAPWRFQLMIDERDGDDWVYRRDARVRRPVASLTWTRDGVAYLAPEVQLLYKSKSRRPKDERDLEEVLPGLGRAERRWLADALHLAHPGHGWLGRL